MNLFVEQAWSILELGFWAWRRSLGTQQLQLPKSRGSLGSAKEFWPRQQRLAPQHWTQCRTRMELRWLQWKREVLLSMTRLTRDWSVLIIWASKVFELDLRLAVLHYLRVWSPCSRVLTCPLTALTLIGHDCRGHSLPWMGNMPFLVEFVVAWRPQHTLRIWVCGELFPSSTILQQMWLNCFRLFLMSLFPRQVVQKLGSVATNAQEISTEVPYFQQVFWHFPPTCLKMSHVLLIMSYH